MPYNRVFTRGREPSARENPEDGHTAVVGFNFGLRERAIIHTALLESEYGEMVEVARPSKRDVTTEFLVLDTLRPGVRAVG